MSRPGRYFFGGGGGTFESPLPSRQQGVPARRGGGSLQLQGGAGENFLNLYIENTNRNLSEKHGNDAFFDNSLVRSGDIHI